MENKFDTVIGLEIHAELSTDTKMYCSCSASFGSDVNTHICPVCTSQPGALPVVNRKAVEYAIKAGLAFNCDINRYTRFDRKNYFYPDLPKAYQISQLDLPLCINGNVTLSTGTKVRIHQIHMEEDAGKLTHDDYNDISLADYNRCSVPLIEIVTEPDIKSGEEAAEFVEKIGLYLKYLGVCDAKMQEGSIRADVNISLKEKGSSKLGERAEIKNLNSMKAMMRAIEYEEKRQARLIENGEKVEQETRRFDDATGETKPMRSKENANDYRYFPEPDILAITFTDEDIENIRKEIPVLPDERFRIYTEDFGLAKNDAKIISGEKFTADFYDDAVKAYPEYKSVANMFLTEIMRIINETHMEEISINPVDFAELIKMIDDKKVNRNDAKAIIRIMFEEGGKPMEIAEKNGFIVKEDSGAIVEFITNLLDSKPDLLKQYFDGKTNMFGFFMGQAAKELKGKATPASIKACLEEEIEKRRP